MGQPKLSRLSLWGDSSSNPLSEGRAYKHPITLQNYPSVTTVLKKANKDGLIQWAADESMRWAVENWMILGNKSDDQAFRAGRWQWKKTRDNRAEVGTGVHEWIEADHTTWDYPELDEEQEAIISQWEDFKTRYEVEPILSEFTVFNSEARVMGTADGYWMIDGVPSLVDIKTSKNHWPEHDAQLAALWYADCWFEEVEEMKWEERQLPEFEQAAIVHLRSDKSDLIIVENLDIHYRKFLAYREIWDADHELKEIQRKKEKSNPSPREIDIANSSW